MGFKGAGLAASAFGNGSFGAWSEPVYETPTFDNEYGLAGSSHSQGAANIAISFDPEELRYLHAVDRQLWADRLWNLKSEFDQAVRESKAERLAKIEPRHDFLIVEARKAAAAHHEAKQLLSQLAQKFDLASNAYDTHWQKVQRVAAEFKEKNQRKLLSSKGANMSVSSLMAKLS